MADNIKSLKSQLEQDIEALMEERRKRLNEAIQANNLTLQALEQQIGVAKSSIQRYLTGETIKIPIDFFEKIAYVTGVPVEHLACYDIKKTAPINTNQGDLMKVVQQLSGDDEKQVREFAELLLLRKQTQEKSKK